MDFVCTSMKFHRRHSHVSTPRIEKQDTTRTPGAPPVPPSVTVLTPSVTDQPRLVLNLAYSVRVAGAL